MWATKPATPEPVRTVAGEWSRLMWKPEDSFRIGHHVANFMPASSIIGERHASSYPPGDHMPLTHLANALVDALLTACLWSQHAKMFSKFAYLTDAHLHTRYPFPSRA